MNTFDLVSLERKQLQTCQASKRNRMNTLNSVVVQKNCLQPVGTDKDISIYLVDFVSTKIQMPQVVHARELRTVQLLNYVSLRNVNCENQGG